MTIDETVFITFPLWGMAICFVMAWLMKANADGVHPLAAPARLINERADAWFGRLMVRTLRRHQPK